MLTWPAKYHDEVLDYGVDWSLRLGNDTISGATAVATVGSATVNSVTFTNTTQTVWLGGGNPGEDCLIACKIVTVSGRTIEESVAINVER